MRWTEQFAGPEWLCGSRSDLTSNESIACFEPVDQSSIGRMIDDLAAVGEDCVAFAFHERAHVEGETWRWHRAQMRAVVVEQFLRVDWSAFDRALRQLRIKSRVLSDARDCEVIWMRVLRVRQEKYVAAPATKDCSERVPCFDCGRDLAVLESELLPAASENSRCFESLCCAQLARALRRRFAIGHVDDKHVVPLFDESRDRSAHSQLSVIGVRRDNNNLQCAGYWVAAARC